MHNILLCSKRAKLTVEQVQLRGPPSIFEVNTDLTNAEHKPVSV